MNKSLSLTAILSSSLLLAACGAEDNNLQTEPVLENRSVSYVGQTAPAEFTADNQDAIAMANEVLVALRSRAETTKPQGELNAANTLIQIGGVFNTDDNGLLKSITKSVTALPLDVKGKAKQVSNDASSTLCESGVATIFGTTDIDKNKKKGLGYLDLNFDDCTTKTDGNTLNGTIQLQVGLGLQDTDIGMEFKDLVIDNEGKITQLVGWLNLNIDYKYLIVHKETISWHITTASEGIQIANLGEVVVDEFDKISFSTTFEDKSGISFKLDNVTKKSLFSQDVTGTLFLPNYGSLTIDTDKLEFCPDSNLLKSGELKLQDTLGNIIKINGNGCDTFPIVIPLPKV